MLATVFDDKCCGPAVGGIGVYAREKPGQWRTSRSVGKAYAGKIGTNALGSMPAGPICGSIGVSCATCPNAGNAASGCTQPVVHGAAAVGYPASCDYEGGVSRTANETTDHFEARGRNCMADSMAEWEAEEEADDIWDASWTRAGGELFDEVLDRVFGDDDEPAARRRVGTGRMSRGEKIGVAVAIGGTLAVVVTAVVLSRRKGK